MTAVAAVQLDDVCENTRLVFRYEISTSFFSAIQKQIRVWDSLVPRLLRGRSKEPGTHCLHMLSYPRISGALETSGYYAAISLHLSSYYRSLHAYNSRWWCFQKSLGARLTRC